MDPNLYSAIQFNNTTEFLKAVEKDANWLDARTKRGDTVLHRACKSGGVAMVELILGQRPDMVSSKNLYGETPMHAACMRDNLHILKMLMESDDQRVAAEVDNRGRSPLYVACFYGHVHLVEYLLQYRWIPGSDEDGRLCLHLAITRKSTENSQSTIVRLLLTAYPTLVLKTDGNGNTALHVAVSNRRFLVATYLITTTQVDVDARNNQGKTALDIVAGYGSRDFSSIVFHRLLAEKQRIYVLEAGNEPTPDFPAEEYLINNTTVDVDARNIEGKTALDIVAGDGSHDVSSGAIHTLVAEKQRIYVSDARNEPTPDFPAEDFSSTSTEFSSQDDSKGDGEEDEIHPEEELTRVDVYARNIQGKTALDIVAGYGNHDIGSRAVHKLLAEKQIIHGLKARNEPTTDFPADDFDSSSPKFPSHDQQDDCKGDGGEEDEIHPEEELTSRASDNVGLGQHKLKSMRQRKNLEKLYRKQQQERVKERRIYQEALQNARNTVVIVAVLIATVAFQAGVSPPGGVYQDGPYIGKSVLARTTAFKVFMVSNTAGLSISLGIVIVLVSVIPFRRKPLVRILKYSHRAMWAAVFFMATAFIAASWATLPSYPHDKAEVKWMKAVVVVGVGGGLGAMFLGWGVMLGTHLKRKSEWRRTRIHDSKQEASRSGNEGEIKGSEPEKSHADDAVKVVKRRLKEDFGNWSECSSNSDVGSNQGRGYHPV